MRELKGRLIRTESEKLIRSLTSIQYVLHFHGIVVLRVGMSSVPSSYLAAATAVATVATVAALSRVTESTHRKVSTSQTRCVRAGVSCTVAL